MERKRENEANIRERRARGEKGKGREREKGNEEKFGVHGDRRLVHRCFWFPRILFTRSPF